MFSGLLFHCYVSILKIHWGLYTFPYFRESTLSSFVSCLLSSHLSFVLLSFVFVFLYFPSLLPCLSSFLLTSHLFLFSPPFVSSYLICPLCSHRPSLSLYSFLSTLLFFPLLFTFSSDFLSPWFTNTSPLIYLLPPTIPFSLFCPLLLSSHLNWSPVFLFISSFFSVPLLLTHHNFFLTWLIRLDSSPCSPPFLSNPSFHQSVLLLFLDPSPPHLL